MVPDLSGVEVALYGAIGVWGVKEFIVPLVRGSFVRNLQAKDEADKAAQKKVEDLEKKVNDVEKTHERKMNELERAQGQFDTKLANTTAGIQAELSSIKGRLEALDTRIEKSGKAHDDRLKEALTDVTVELNRKLSSMFNTELERTVRDVLREELGRRPVKDLGGPP